MGNCQTVCQDPEKTQENGNPTKMKLKKKTSKIVDSIIDNRIKLQDFPRVPSSIKKKIQKLQEINYQQKYNEYKSTTIIWRMKNPINFCYINEAQYKNDEPKGNCIVYLYKEKGQFSGYFHGRIDDSGNRQTNKSIYIFPNGSYFLGDPIKTNYGMFINETTSYKYEGEWCDDQPHGNGKQQSPKGVYEGTFKRGLKDGKGIMTFPNKQMIYEGEFKNDEISGEGKIWSANGKYEYIGQFIKGQKHGLGVEKNESILYEGYFHHNDKSGEGKLILQKENIEYEGEFYGNQIHGKGRMRKNGHEISGVWQKGKLSVLLSRK